MKFIKCHFAIPERYQGMRVYSWRNISGRFALAEIAGMRGAIQVPEWWLDRQVRDR